MTQVHHVFDPSAHAAELDTERAHSLNISDGKAVMDRIAAFREQFDRGEIDVERDPEKPRLGKGWTHLSGGGVPREVTTKAAWQGVQRDLTRDAVQAVWRVELSEVEGARPKWERSMGLKLDLGLVPELDGRPKFEPEAWERLCGLEEQTVPFRLWRANCFGFEASRAAQGLKKRGPKGAEVVCAPDWYRQRAAGQYDRFLGASTCGEDEIMYACPAQGCHCAGISTLKCANARLCVACRALQAKKRQARYGEARVSFVDEFARKYPDLMHARNADRYSEKLLTLTLPNLEIDPYFPISDAVRARLAKAWGCKLEEVDVFVQKPFGAEDRIVALRVEVLFRAWRFFTKKLYRYLEAERARIMGITPTQWRRRKRRNRRLEKTVKARLFLEKPEHEWTPEELRVALDSELVQLPELPPFALYRAFEWTVGNEGVGHPHFHVWMLTPRLPGRVDPVTGKVGLREWWREALRQAGMKISDDDDVVVDVREVKERGGRDLRAELIKSGGKSIQWERASRLSLRSSRKGEDVAKYVEGWCIVDKSQTGSATPTQLARVYEALDGRRLVQASRGFLARAVESNATGCVTHGPEGMRMVTTFYKGEVPREVAEAVAERQKFRGKKGAHAPFTPS